MMGISNNLGMVIGGVSEKIQNIPKMETEVSKNLGLEVLHNIQRPPPQGCPVDTGNLSRNHFVRQAGTSAELYTTIYYWIYVVFGRKSKASHSSKIATYMGQVAGGKGGNVSGNDYPTRALQDMISSGAYDKIVKDAAHKYIIKPVGV